MTTRILTAAVGILIGLVILFFADTLVFNAALAVVSAIIVRELFVAAKCTVFKSSYIVCMLYVAALPFLSEAFLLPYRYMFTTACIFFLFLTYLLNFKTLNFDKLSFMVMSTAMVSLSIGCLLSIKNIDSIHGIFYVALTLAGAWIADSAAYFVGTLMGKHKLAPDISPKKTVEGAVGAILLTGIFLALISFGYMKYQETQNIFFDVNYMLIVVLGMASAVLGILGDLTASLLKRQCQIKDYGHIMPGHGGMLDRFDSVLFVAPFINIILQYVRIFN